MKPMATVGLAEDRLDSVVVVGGEEEEERAGRGKRKGREGWRMKAEEVSWKQRYMLV
jgi:hypothetical protein